jgi:hypothetical protein
MSLVDLVRQVKELIVSFKDGIVTVAKGEEYVVQLHCKKRLSIFSSPAGMWLTKLSLAGNN